MPEAMDVVTLIWCSLTYPETTFPAQVHFLIVLSKGNIGGGGDHGPCGGKGSTVGCVWECWWSNKAYLPRARDINALPTEVMKGL